MAQVYWAKPALSDLREIVEFIAQDSAAYAQRLGMKIAQSPPLESLSTLLSPFIPKLDTRKSRFTILR
jgi:hypothetical protein